MVIVGSSAHGSKKTVAESIVLSVEPICVVKVISKHPCQA
jgi:hypothetical protein